MVNTKGETSGGNLSLTGLRRLTLQHCIHSTTSRKFFKNARQFHICPTEGTQWKRLWRDQRFFCLFFQQNGFSYSLPSIPGNHSGSVFKFCPGSDHVFTHPVLLFQPEFPSFSHYCINLTIALLLLASLSPTLIYPVAREILLRYSKSSKNVLSL